MSGLGLVLTSSTNVRAVDEVAAKRIAQATKKMRLFMHERDDAIIQAHLKGASLREIAEQADMHHTGVKKLIERHLFALEQAAREAEKILAEEAEG